MNDAKPENNIKARNTSNELDVTDWVLLRGLCRGSFYWHQFPKHLKSAFPRTKLYAPDLAGNGERYRETSPKSIKGMVDNYRAALPRAISNSNIKTKHNIIALSLGGMVGLQWLKEYPEEVNKLIVINTSVRQLTAFYERIQLSALKQLFLAHKTDLKHFEASVLQLTSNMQHSNTDLMTEWYSYTKQHPVSSSNSLRQLWAAARFTLPLFSEHERQRIIVVQSLGDCLVAPSCSQRLAQELQAEHWVHPDAGHDLTLDGGEWLINKLKHAQLENRY